MIKKDTNKNKIQKIFFKKFEKKNTKTQKKTQTKQKK